MCLPLSHGARPGVTVAHKAGLTYSTTLIKLVIPGPAVPKARPRLGLHGNVYTPRRTLEGEARLLGYLKASYPSLRPAGGFFSVSLDYHLKGEPKVDLDNLIKLVMDAFNKRVWADDSMVTQLWARKHLHSRAPRTEITIHQLHTAEG